MAKKTAKSKRPTRSLSKGTSKGSSSAKTKTLPPRAKVKVGDTWDLGSLFESDAGWEGAFGEWEKKIGGYEAYRGHLGDSPEKLGELLRFDTDFDRMGERLGTYAFLRATEDQAASDAQRMKGRYQLVAAKAAEAASFIRPELMEIPPEKIDGWLDLPELSEWRITLERILRYRPHTLSRSEEQLLAMQGPMSEAANQAFGQLNDADLKWPILKNEKGEKVELSHSSFSAFLRSPDRRVRKNAFEVYYAGFDGHKNTLAATYNGSVQRDVYFARARNFKTAREAALFADRVPLSVYDNLIESIHANLPAVYRYYELRRRKMGLKDIHHYDTYVPILADLQKKHSWDQAVNVVLDSLEPLGSEYVSALQKGLGPERWADRYPNQGKRSGAFSSGSYDGAPYILMNYEPTVLEDVFTLTHEAGHSMHSWYSARNQPFQYYSYTIFVAEVASTFNEQLLARHMMDKAKNKSERAYLLNRQIDGIRATIVRQTMFAEFEKISHALVEGGEPLTVETLRREYRKLLDLYFGPDFAIDPTLELECLRIPHFYRAFYVYKYATGLSAAIALSQRVLTGGERELTDYLNFLKGGCSQFPLDLLRAAGVDMETPAPVNAAMQVFADLVAELEELL